jgi:NTE family protein
MKRIGLFIILGLLLVSALPAQRVGVVFSGGGAKGLYHIGILKALEENRIPVDYIAGTSMGAIVAGLYAIGYTPDEIARLFLSDQVKLWMSGRIESEYSYYFNRMKPRQDMFSLNLDFKASKKNIAVLPTNLIPSTQLDMAFNEIFATATAGAEGDFDRLFIPFRCVASDTYNKREIIFRSGDVGRAIRASMTIPFVFQPLKNDSVMLYDGGIFNNFPWQVLEKDFHPDVFIGGKCIKGNLRSNDTNIFEQIESITMMHTDFNLPEDRSVLVERVFDDVGLLDFSRAQYVIDAGYADAMAQMDSIKALVTRRQNSAQLHNRRLAFRSRLPELIFDDYRVEGLNADQSRYVRRMLGLDEEIYRTFDFREFKSAYFKLLSEGDILGDYPRMEYNDSIGYFSVRLPLRTRPSFRIKFGGNISSTSLQQAYFGMEYKTIARRAHTLNFDGNFSAMYTSVRNGWRTDFYLGIPVFFELAFHHNKYNYRRAPNWSTFGKYGYHGYRDTYFTSSLGIPWGRNSAIQARFHLADNTYDYFEREYIPAEYGSSDRTKFQFYGVQLEATSRTLNFPQFPTRGIAQHVSVIFVNGREQFLPGENYLFRDENGDPPQNAQGEAMKGYNPFPNPAGRRWIGARYAREEYFPLLKWFSLGYLAEATFTTRPDFYTPHATNFVSPGFTPTPYSRSLYMDKFRSPYYIGAGLMPTIEFGDNFYLKNSIHLFISDKMLERGLRLTDKLRHIVESSLVYQTPIGPASLTVTNYEETSRKWFIVFNFGYTLFGNRGLFY